jgi:hypothetical protein
MWEVGWLELFVMEEGVGGCMFWLFNPKTARWMSIFAVGVSCFEAGAAKNAYPAQCRVSMGYPCCPVLCRHQHSAVLQALRQHAAQSHEHPERHGLQE